MTASNCCWSVQNLPLSTLVQGLLVSVYYLCTLDYIMSTSYCAYAFEELTNSTIISFVGCSQGIRTLNVSVAMTFRPSVKFS